MRVGGGLHLLRPRDDGACEALGLGLHVLGAVHAAKMGGGGFREALELVRERGGGGDEIALRHEPLRLRCRISEAAAAGDGGLLELAWIEQSGERWRIFRHEMLLKFGSDDRDRVRRSRQLNLMQFSTGSRD
jgi:hypothetical protein